MRHLVPLFIALLAFIGCASAPPRQPLRLMPAADVSIVSAVTPMPMFESQPNWVIVKDDDTASPDTIAVVTLQREELGGMMKLMIVRSNGVTLEGYASELYEKAERSGDASSVLAVPGLTPDVERGIVWQSGDPPSDPMGGKMLVRIMPGHPEYLVLCAGWWPASAMDFLLSPLHAACASVRLPPQ